MMNNADVLLQAKYFAQRVMLEAGHEPEARIDRAFELALARLPSATEKRAALDFVATVPTGLVDLCRTLFNLNEFVYRP